MSRVVREDSGWRARAALASIAIAVAAIPASNALGVAAGGLEFAEWTSVSSNTATGTLSGRPISLTGTHVSPPPGSVVDGTAPTFSGPSFSPSIPQSDAIEIRGATPANDYTLDLGGPTPNPVIHLASLRSTLTFAPGSEIRKVSGEGSLVVDGRTVTGLGDGPNDDSDGTIRLIGLFSQVPFAAEWSGPDGIFVQAGADFAAPETTITSGVPDGTIVDDVAPAFEFSSSEPGSGFECRAYDPASPVTDDPTKVFRPCTSPFRDPTTEIAAGRSTVFEVRAIDSSGNADPTPASAEYVKRPLAKGPKKTKCDPVAVDRVIGRDVEENCRITQIRDDRVTCMAVNTGKTAKCPFDRERQRWILSKTGNQFAIVGDPISKGDSPRGKWVIAAPVGDRRTSPCADEGAVEDRDRAASRDAAGIPKGMTLNSACVYEYMGVGGNASGLAMDNYATRTVCSSDPVASDVASAIPVPSPEPGVFCFTGEGAGLNDPNGQERDFDGRYRGTCHVIISNGAEVYAAKRPNVSGWPATVNIHTPMWWRPYAPRVAIAN